MQKTPQWKNRVQEIFQTCQEELKRTTEIGKKMLSATKTNTNLHEAYEEVGTIVVKAIRNGELDWNNPRVKELINIIENCEQDLEEIEDEVNKIRFAQGPVDISKTSEVKESKAIDQEDN
ncbi:MAG: hypothetical protein GY909_04800 [Oligoflexia bacterium]|nr:hypothetical protein [Oligoflexia bacterium]